MVRAVSHGLRASPKKRHVAGGELRRVQLPQTDGTGGAKARNESCVLLGDVTGEHARAGGGGQSHDVDDVFVGDGHAVQWSTGALGSVATFVVGIPRSPQSSVAVDVDERVQLRVEALDAIQIRERELNR